MSSSDAKPGEQKPDQNKSSSTSSMSIGVSVAGTTAGPGQQARPCLISSTNSNTGLPLENNDLLLTPAVSPAGSPGAAEAVAPSGDLVGAGQNSSSARRPSPPASAAASKASNASNVKAAHLPKQAANTARTSTRAMKTAAAKSGGAAAVNKTPAGPPRAAKHATSNGPRSSVALSTNSKTPGLGKLSTGGGKKASTVGEVIEEGDWIKVVKKKHPLANMDITQK